MTTVSYRGRTLTFGDIARAYSNVAPGTTVTDPGIYVSRVADPDDANYAADASDVSRATILQLSEAEEIGAKVTAVIPHKDSVLLAATASSLWMLQGDPVTGNLRNISRSVGIVSQLAWTKDGDAVYFLAADGLYRVSAGGDGLQNISRDLIPAELLNQTGVACEGMIYSQTNHGIFIYTATQDWFFALDPIGFWPVDDSANSHVLVGPIRLGATGTFGQVNRIHGILGASSAAVNWRIIVGDSAEDAAANGKLAIGYYQSGSTSSWEAMVAASGALAAGRNHSAYPKVRGVWAVVWLQSAGTWGYESLLLELTQSGRWN